MLSPFIRNVQASNTSAGVLNPECSTGAAVISSATAMRAAKVSADIGAFREVLMEQQAVGVLVWFPFPWRVRVGEIDRDISSKAQRLTWGSPAGTARPRWPTVSAVLSLPAA